MEVEVTELEDSWKLRAVVWKGTVNAEVSSFGEGRGGYQREQMSVNKENEEIEEQPGESSLKET